MITPAGHPSVRRLAVVLVAAGLAVAGCADDSDTAGEGGETSDDGSEGDTETTSSTTAPRPETPPPTVTGPITAGAGPVIPQPAPPLPEGYVEEEFFIGGEATSYALVGAAGEDGVWSVEPDDTAPYETRVIVRRPPAEEFSGVVVVEWLNVSAVEAGPDWGYASEEISDAGHAYVAVSAQALGVEGGQSILDVEVDEEAAEAAGSDADEVAEGGLVNIDPERYGTLAHPGDAYAYDMYSQVATALRNDADTILGGLEPTTLIAVGESQSAGFLTSYVNAVHPVAGVYDAFLVHSRGGGSAGLAGFSDDEEGSSFTNERVLIRTDLDEPVFIVEAETDLTLLGYAPARQPDTETVHTWELAGTAHSDSHVFRAILGGGRDPSLGSILGCTTLINSGPHHEGVQAALAHLVTWADGGAPPPAGEPIEIDTVDGATVIVRDDLGIAIGGVRNPLVDVPVVVTSGDPPPGLSIDRSEGFDVCALFGQTIPLDQATLVELYGTADGYVEAFTTATEAAVDAGYLTPSDGEQLLEEAETNRALFG